MTTAPRGDVAGLFATPGTIAEHRADGSIVLRSPEPLREGARCTGDWLEHWARQTPDAIFLAERDGADTPWGIMTYAGALRRVRAAASWILAQKLSVERPVVILSDNSIDHALLALAAIKPLHKAQIVSGRAGDADALAFRDVSATPETSEVAKAFAAVTPDTIAKFLFTSGSTGTPKAVINTQRMLTSSQQAKAQTWTFIEPGRGDLVILDWLPWSHTFGANHNFNLVLRNGGTLYVLSLIHI